jgi:Domain of unknown function (DUF3291)
MRRRLAYRSPHTEVMRRRREWFERMAEAYLVLWWVPVAERPTPAEAVNRLERLRQLGPTPDAFTSRHPFAPPGTLERPRVDDRWSCPTG